VRGKKKTEEEEENSTFIQKEFNHFMNEKGTRVYVCTKYELE
jgi:hypothetical protein